MKSLYEELKARNAQPGDRVVCEDGVYVVTHNEHLLDSAGNCFHPNSRFYKKFLRLDRPDDGFWDNSCQNLTWSYMGFNYHLINPTPPKRKITIEVEEGAEVIVNGKRVEV